MSLKIFGQKKVPRHVIGIAAGKGGVGKSTMTALLALALQHLGYRVGVLDADLYGPSMRTMLPEDSLPEQKGDLLFPASSNGILSISMAFLRPKGEASVIRAPIANRLISQFIDKVQWGDLDYLLIDFPPGTGDIQITLSQQAHLTASLIVTTAQKVALDDVKKCIEMFEQVRVPILGIVENMSYFQNPVTQEKNYLFGKGGGLLLSQEKNLPFLGSIPLNPLVGESLDQGKSIFLSDDEELKETFLELAKKMIVEIELLKTKNQSIAILGLRQKDAKTFTIEWSDGVSSDYTLAEVQRNCPCAACREDPKRDLPPDPSAHKIESVGSYALKVDFKTGCSHGIYSFDLLRTIKGLSC